MFWIDLFYANAAEEPLLKFTGLERFTVMCAAVALAGMRQLCGPDFGASLFRFR